MKNTVRQKANALIWGVMPVALSYVLQLFVTVAGYLVVYAAKKRADPQALPEVLRNRALTAAQNAAPWWSIVSSALFLLLVAWFFHCRGTSLRKAAHLRPIDLRAAFPYLLLAGVGLNLAVSGLLAYFPFPQSWWEQHEQVTGVLSRSGLLAQILCVTVAAPLCEEVIFRGLALSSLRKGFPVPVAVVLQAALFGISHGSKLQLVYAFVSGLVFGAVFYACRSVWACVIAHAVFNGSSLLLAGVSGPGPFLTLTGGAFLVFLALRNLHFKFKKPDWAMET